MSGEATQTPTSLFTAHCTLCEKCPLGIRSHETYRNYPTTSQASLHLNTTHCKLIWGISKSIRMKCTQINREITACPRSHPVPAREKHGARQIVHSVVWSMAFYSQCFMEYDSSSFRSTEHEEFLFCFVFVCFLFLFLFFFLTIVYQWCDMEDAGLSLISAVTTIVALRSSLRS